MAPHVQALIEDKGLADIQGNSSVVFHRRDVGISNRRFLSSALLRALLLLLGISLTPYDMTYDHTCS